MAKKITPWKVYKPLKMKSKKPTPELVVQHFKKAQPDNQEPKQPIVVEVNVDIHPRIPYYKPLIELVWEGFVSAYVGAVTGLIILAFAFI